MSLPLVQARIEMQRGNPALAVQLLERPGLTKDPLCSRSLICAVRPTSIYAVEQTPQPSFRKYSTTEACRRPPLFTGRACGTGARRSLAGDTTKARRAYQDFFALWKDADADIPILQQARREYEKLNAAPLKGKG